MATFVKMLRKKGQEEEESSSTRLRLGNKILSGVNVCEIPQQTRLWKSISFEVAVSSTLWLDTVVLSETRCFLMFFPRLSFLQTLHIGLEILALYQGVN